MKTELLRLMMKSLVAAVLLGSAGLHYVKASSHQRPGTAKIVHPVGHDDDDLEHVRDAVERGDIKSLAVLRRIVLSQVDGDIVATKFKREKSRGTYEFKILRADGHLVEAEIDAASGTILEIEND
ncbi:MAG: PepSY domain-containing protein [Allorhizobium sp.]